MKRPGRGFQRDGEPFRPIGFGHRLRRRGVIENHAGELKRLLLNHPANPREAIIEAPP